LVLDQPATELLTRHQNLIPDRVAYAHSHALHLWFIGCRKSRYYAL